MHRDLKPANIGILSLDPPHAVVLDLGCAIHVDELTAKSRDVGTIGYLAPEMEDDDPKLYGTKVDVWAMGCVALELLLPRRDGPRIPWDPAYYFPPEDGKSRRRLHFNPWRPVFTKPCPTKYDLQAQRDKHKKVHRELNDSDDSLQNLVAQMLVVPSHWRADIQSVVKELEGLRIDDWQGKVTAESVPSQPLRHLDQSTEDGSMPAARKSMKTRHQYVE
jgi:serine/threonine protein kinase